MPTFTEEEIDSVIWPWIKEIIKNPTRVEEALDEREREAEQQNTTITTLVRSAERLIAELVEEKERVFTLYKKGKLDEQRWEVEDKAYTKQIAEQQEQRVKLSAQVSKPTHSQAYLQDVREACAIIAEGIDNFNREEKREVYELLSLKAVLSIENNDRIINAECVLDARRLIIKASKSNDGASSDLTFSSSSIRPWLAPGRSTQWLRRSARRSPAAAEPATRDRSSTRRTRIFA
jgi:hypothetical protein